MQNARLLGAAIACLAAIVAGIWYWSSRTPAAAPSAGGPPPTTGQAAEHIAAATAQTNSTPSARAHDDGLVPYRITRAESGFDEACGIATADFRVRRDVVIPAGSVHAVIGWDASFGAAALLYSDRRPPLHIGGARTSVRLRPLPDNVVAVEHADATGCELITRSVSPADWVFAVAESASNPRLDAVVVDPTSLVRAVYRGAGKVSDWSDGTNVAALAPVHQAVSVHVETVAGRPVAGAVVLAIDDAGAVRDRGLTDEHGEALLRVPDGWQRWVADRDGMVAAASRDLHGARIVLRDARSIDIALTVRDQGPVAQGKVSWPGPVERSAIVSAGRARLRDVAKGPVKVLLADGGPWAETEVPGEVVQYDWLLEASDSLEGVVEGLLHERHPPDAALHGNDSQARISWQNSRHHHVHQLDRVGHQEISCT